MNRRLGIIAILLVIIMAGCSNQDSLRKEDKSSEALSDRAIIDNIDVKLHDEIPDDEYKQRIKQLEDEARISYDDYSDENIVHISTLSNSTEKSRSIKGIQIYFKNAQDEDIKNIGLDDAIKIMENNTPKDIVEKYYGEPEAIKILSKEDNDKGTVYVLKYSLTDQAKEEHNKEHSYPGQLTTYVSESPDGKIESISIGTFAPRWMSSLDLNGYKKEEWNINKD